MNALKLAALGAPYAVALLCALALCWLMWLGWALWRRQQRPVLRARFGAPEMVAKLVQGASPVGRKLKLAAMALGLLALTLALLRPQAKAGTKVLPATTLDVVLVLDFSKSMYARDVQPDRIGRAKLEVAELVRALPGARFGAVAFAGEPMSFPLTQDGAAIAQFFRQLEPNDMPVGGTAIARALERARELFARDPRSKQHERVIVLITDGEDLEGDPIAAAERCQRDGTRVDVVQIGSASAEPIPEIDERGRLVGTRRDRQGRPLTSQLSAAGEAQLQRIAAVGGGTLVRSSAGGTGLRDITSSLRRTVQEELSERAILVWDELYTYPLAMALLCLWLDLALAERWLARRALRHTPPARTPGASP